MTCDLLRSILTTVTGVPGTLRSARRVLHQSIRPCLAATSQV